MQETLRRDAPVVPGQAALRFIDVQNYSAHRHGGEFKGLDDAELERRSRSFFDELECRTLPNVQRLQAAGRAARVEIMYTVIESLTLDGRDCSLDVRMSGVNVPKGSWDAQVLAEIAPDGDEIVFPKSSTSVFVSTSIDCVLGNFGVPQLILSGLLTDQCLESAVRDACDRGYLVTLVTDACATYTSEQHLNSLKACQGFCRQVTTAQILEELSRSSSEQWACVRRC
jgi:ureidoacrylate peracid hydrolase